MAIHVDVFTRLNERRVRQDAKTVVDEFDRAGDRAGQAFGQKLSGGIERSAPLVERAASRMEKSTDRVADSLGRVNVEQAKYDELSKKSTASDRQKIQQAEALAKAQRAHAAAIRDASRAVQDHIRVQRTAEQSTSGSDGVASSLRNTTTAMSALGGAVRSPAAVAAIAPALLQVGSAAIAASGSLLVLPGVLGAVGTAFGTLALATSGFSDAIGNINDPAKFAESLRSLSPNAQQAALSIQSLMPALNQFKAATQDALFANVGPQLEQLSAAMLPQIQQLTTTVSSAMNQMLMGVTDTLMANPVLTGQITQNIGQAFQSLAPAASSLTQALTSLVAVGSTFLPELARGASEAASAFATMIQESARTGELQTAIRDGITVLGMMVDALVEAGKMFGALATDGVAAMADIKMQVEAVSTVIRIASGDTEAWANVFPSIGSIAAQAFAEVGNSIDTYVLGPLRAAIDLINKIPGMDIGNIPDFQFTNEGVIVRSNTPIPGTNTPGFAGQPALGGGANASRERRGAPPIPAAGQRDLPSGTPGAWWPGFGTSGQRGGGFYTQGEPGYAAGAAPDRSRGGGPKLPDAPVLPFGPKTSTAPTAALYSAENSLFDAQHALAEKRARLTQLEQSNAATANDLQDARNDVVESERAEHEAQLRLNEARMSANEQGIKQLNSAANQLGDIGAKLDQDFGLSKGLPGLAENLFKFVANLAAAPLLGQLGAVSAMNPIQGGHGIMGMLGAQGVFGSKYQNNQYAQQASAMGPAGLGGYPGDAALLSNVPSGRYTQEERGDLTQGLADCSSAVEDLVNLMDGQSTAGASMSTGNAAEWLTARGFIPGSMPGAFNVGFNGGHMQATLPGGTPFNWGSDAAAARGGVGGTGAFDPSFTSNYYRPVGGGGGGGGISAGSSSGYLTPSLAPAVGPSTNTNPALTNPAAPGGWRGPGVPTSMTGGRGEGPALGGRPAGPGIGAGTSATPLGGLAPPSGSGGGGVGIASGGLVDMGMQAGGMALDMMAPGAGQAAQMGMKLANRAIEFGSQAVGIGASGLMETFLPTGGSELANSNWLTKIAGGIAGASAALPNLAGGKDAQALAGQPAQSDPAAGQGGTNNQYDVKIDAAARDSGGLMRDFEYHTSAAAAAPGM